MAAYFEDRGLVWDLSASAAPKPADVAAPARPSPFPSSRRRASRGAVHAIERDLLGQS
jgi:hypothetical protein